MRFAVVAVQGSGLIVRVDIAGDRIVDLVFSYTIFIGGDNIDTLWYESIIAAFQ
jgi:hypothetical protein